MPNFICLDCNEVNTFSKACSNRYCKRCKGHSLLSETAYSHISQTGNKLCLFCLNYTHIATIDKTPIVVCNSNMQHIEDIKKCPINKW